MKNRISPLLFLLILSILFLWFSGSAYAKAKVFVKEDDPPDVLMNYLKQPDPTKKQLNHIRAAEILGNRRYRPAVPVLIEALKSANPVLVRAILIALGNIGDPSARPTVEMYLNHSKEKVKRAAINALAKIPPGPGQASLPQITHLPPSKDTTEKGSAPVLSPGLKKRIAVVDFSDKTTQTKLNLGSRAYYMLVTELVKSENFVVVERDALQKVIKEQTRGMEGTIDQNTAAEVGRILGVNAIVLGTVLEYGMTGGTSRAVNDVRLVDTKTAQIILAESAEGKGIGGYGTSEETLASTALRESINILVQKIINKMATFPWEGRIMEVSGEKIYVNAGETSGLRQGTLLGVYREGKELIDPATGLRKGFEEDKIGLIIVHTVKKDYSIAQKKSGTGFKRNDLLRIEDEEESEESSDD